jgi:uncharacterized protein
LHLYLHGFASGANSHKANFFTDRYAQQGIQLVVPDFNAGGFTDFTISRQLAQAASHFTDEPVTLIGSSLGGWVSLLLAEIYPQVESMILLAPALGFPQPWLSQLGATALQTWQTAGSWPVYHYIEKQHIPLAYNFVLDAQQYLQTEFQRSLPTLIFHGINDEVVPIELSRQYASDRSHSISGGESSVTLHELASDHGLSNVLTQIWQEMQQPKNLATYLAADGD